MPFSLVRLNKLINDFHSPHQKRNDLEVVFADLQILVRKIIAHKLSFRTEVNKQPKHQYAHELHAQYYTAIACSALQTSDHMESFTQFHGPLVLLFGSHSKPGKISSWAIAIKTTASTISTVLWEPKLSKNS